LRKVIDRDGQRLFLIEGLVILFESSNLFLDAEHLRVVGLELGLDQKKLLLLIEALERLLAESSFGVEQSKLLKVIDL
jgi:hypothetical protein